LLDEVIRLLEAGVYQSSAAGAAVLQLPLAATSLREEEVCTFLARRFGTEALYANETLADRRIDSLGMIELIVSLEEALGIACEAEQVSPSRTEAFVRTVGAVPPAPAPPGRSVLQGEITTPLRTFCKPLSEGNLALLRLAYRLCWGCTPHAERLQRTNAIVWPTPSTSSPLYPRALPTSSEAALRLGKRDVAFLGSSHADPCSS
jgi:acyl carrier protein